MVNFMSFPVRLRDRRLTVARAMVVVALIALALGGARWASALARRSRVATTRAGRHAICERTWAYLVREAGRGDLVTRRNPILGRWVTRAQALTDGIDPDDGSVLLVMRRNHRYPPERQSGPSPAELGALCREKAAYHGRLRAKWSRVARFPWIGAEPDPPGPPLVWELLGEIGDGPY